MARLIGSLNEGSLLRRTALHICTFVLGSLTFVALLSVLLVSAARSILPPPAGAGDDDRAAAADDDEADEPVIGGKPPPSKPRKRGRAAPAADLDTGRADD